MYINALQRVSHMHMNNARVHGCWHYTGFCVYENTTEGLINLEKKPHKYIKEPHKYIKKLQRVFISCKKRRWHAATLKPFNSGTRRRDSGLPS